MQRIKFNKLKTPLQEKCHNSVIPEGKRQIIVELDHKRSFKILEYVRYIFTLRSTMALIISKNMLKSILYPMVKNLLF